MTFEDFEKKEAWLNRAFELRKERPSLDAEWRELQRLRDACTDTSVKIGGTKVGSGNSTENKYIRYAAASDDDFKQLSADRNRYYQIRAEIKAAISALPNGAERAVLYARFIRFKKLSEIAKMTHYSISHVKRLKQRGIAHICIKDDT